MKKSWTDVITVGGVPITVKYNSGARAYQFQIGNHRARFGQKTGAKVYNLLKTIVSVGSERRP